MKRAEAVKMITGEIAQFAKFLADGMRVGDAAVALQIDSWTARQYSAAIAHIRRIDISYDTTLGQLLQLAVGTTDLAPDGLAAIRGRTNETAPDATGAAQRDEWRSS